MNERVRFDELLAPQQAGILCNDPQFQTFAACRTGIPTGQCNASAAAEYLRQVCQITSRKELQNDDTARERFQILRTEFDAWRGRIATPRS